MGRSTAGTDACPAGMTCYPQEQPEHTATIASFRLDLYEVTVGRFRKFVDAYPGSMPAVGAGANPSVPGTGWDAAWASALAVDQKALMLAVKCDTTYQTWTDTVGANEQYAMNCVNWGDAFAFCAWDGGWLPTEAEWEKASAGGDANRLYPWGSQDPSVNMVLANSIHSDRLPFIKVGSHPLGDGRWGHHDLGGGMWEWVFDSYEAAWYGGAGGVCTNCANVMNAPSRVVRGGSWGSNATNLRAAYRNYFTLPNRIASDGIRCARRAP